MIDFESLDFEKKYWFLGLFCTDGHFNGKNTVFFNRQARDRDILEKICRIFALPESALQENQALKPSDELGDYVRLVIRKSDCASLMESLQRQGFTSHKNSVMPPLSFPQEGVRHFLRGVIDGDGCVVDDHVLRVTVSTGAEGFAEYLVEIIRRIDAGLKVHKYVKPEEEMELATQDLYRIEVTGTSAEKLLLRLYDWVEYYGERKFGNFRSVKSQQNRKVATYRAWVECKGLGQPIEGVKAIDINPFEDQRGYLAECYRCDEHDIPTSLAYVSMTHPGIKRGPHLHCGQTDIFTFGPAGLYKIWLLDDRESSSTYKNVQILYGGEDHWLRVVVPPGVVHAYQNISDKDGITINCVSRLYAGLDKKYPVDEVRLDNTEFAEFLFGL